MLMPMLSRRTLTRTTLLELAPPTATMAAMAAVVAVAAAEEMEEQETTIGYTPR